jgi:hypothetical protein
MAIANVGSFFSSFPHLKKSEFQICSPESVEYNCIAWAAGRSDVLCWPNNMMFWPLTCPCEETVDAFIAFFATLGYKPCKDGEKERGIEKIALYAKGSKPKHAARQLRSGKWTSKLGISFDIEHDLKDLEGSTYGNVVLFLCRPLQNS